MANKQCIQLIETVRARAGRSRDTVLITTSFVLDALNDGQLEIVRKIPRLIGLDTTNTTSYKIATVQTSIDISTLNPAHIGGIWILNGGDTRQEGITYRKLDDFRKKYLPVANQSDGEWTEYTRQGNTIYFDCPLSSDYNNLYLHIDYTKWATPFASVTATTQSDIPDSDKGLILFALAEVYDEIALSNPKLESKALKTRALFEEWLEKFRDFNDLQLEESYES